MSSSWAREPVLERTAWIGAHSRQNENKIWFSDDDEQENPTVHRNEYELFTKPKGRIQKNKQSTNEVFLWPIHNLMQVVVAPGHEISQKFHSLSEQWETDTRFLSALEKLVLHTSYQQIIGMGPIVLPLILEKLRDEGGYWFWALRAISGEDPTHEGEHGDFEAMRAKWLEWGTKRGLVLDR